MNRRNRLRVLWRAYVRRRWRALSRVVVRRDIDAGWLIIVLAAFIGLGAGFAIVFTYELLDAIRELAGWQQSAGGPAPGGVAAFLTVPAGLWVARKLRAGARTERGGEMVPMLIRRAAKHGGELPLADTARKLASALVTLGSGGSLGAEGPGAVAGAAVGSAMGQGFRFGPNRRRVLLACGTAAGISAAFNAPIAGVLFALEVVLGTFAVAALSPVVVSAVIGAVISYSLLGPTPAFAVPASFRIGTPAELGLYLLLGGACGILAALYTRLFDSCQDVVRAVGGERAAPLVAGLLIAFMALFHPALLGDGRDGIGLLLASRLTAGAALTLALLKILTSGLTMAGGGAGGVFMPALVVGAGFGSSFGLAAAAELPGLGLTPEAFALAGMAGVAAGATFAPMTAMMLIVEITDDYGLILPLMLVCVLAYLVAGRIEGRSLYSGILARGGDHITQGVDRGILENVPVAACYDRDPLVVLEDAPLSTLLTQLRGSRQSEYPVVTRKLELVGMLSFREISRALEQEQLTEHLIAADLASPEFETVVPGDSLLEASRKMGVRDIDHLPVVDAPGSRKLLGVLGRRDVLEAYQTHLLLED